MCVLCDETKRKFPTYIFCPYCGKNYDPCGFVPKYFIKATYSDCDRYGRPQGLPTLTTIEFKR